MKFRLVGAEFSADSLAEVTKLTVAFRHFVYTPKKLISFDVGHCLSFAKLG
jgi:hypothetical protein